MEPNKTVYIVYCPRCDKLFSSMISKADAWANVIQHLKRTDPDYYEIMVKD